MGEVADALEAQEMAEEAMEQEAEQKFDPSKHLSQARKNGPSDYLQVKWRIKWFRDEHPQGSIVTEIRELSKDRCVVHATVTTTEGAVSTGIGSETPDDFKDFIEKAETKAIGRALAALGYGTQFVDDFEEGTGKDGQLRIADSPTPRGARSPGGGAGSAGSRVPRVPSASGPQGDVVAAAKQIYDAYEEVGDPEQGPPTDQAPAARGASRTPTRAVTPQREPAAPKKSGSRVPKPPAQDDGETRGEEVDQGTGEILEEGGATDAQRDKIKRIWKEMGYVTPSGDADIGEMQGYLEGFYATTWEDLSLAVASQVITELQQDQTISNPDVQY